MFAVVKTIDSTSKCQPLFKIEASMLYQRWNMVARHCDQFSAICQFWYNVVCLLGFHYLERSFITWRSLLIFGEVFNDLERSFIIRRGLPIWRGLILFGEVFTYLERSLIIWRGLLLFGKVFYYLERALPTCIWRGIYLFGEVFIDLERSLLIWRGCLIYMLLDKNNNITSIGLTFLFVCIISEF